MDLVWEIDHQDASEGVQIRVISAMAGENAGSQTGFTKDPTIIALACCAFTYRFWVQMNVGSARNITAMNLLPDCSLSPWTPSPVPEGLGVVSVTIEPSGFGEWPNVSVEFADGRAATDQSKRGIIEPMARAGLISGEGIFDLLLEADTIRHIRLSHEIVENSAARGRAFGTRSP